MYDVIIFIEELFLRNDLYRFAGVETRALSTLHIEHVSY